ncbi:MAG: lipocalin family protein [Bacteroidales bacterium]|nr:lipocalin family protein [Bacteroidales bacterium]
MKTKLVLTLFLAMFIVSGCAQNPKNEIDVKTVEKVELEKYLGTWYEIARFDHSFERDLVGVTATYSLRDDGKITVLNQGYKNTLDGKHSTAKGKAKIPNPKETAKLKVSFFLFFYGDYFILELGENYEYALIGSSSPKYLWILSRTPQMDEETYQMLVDNAQNRGYDVSKLIKVEQKMK